MRTILSRCDESFKRSTGQSCNTVLRPNLRINCCIYSMYIVFAIYTSRKSGVFFPWDMDCSSEITRKLHQDLFFPFIPFSFLVSESLHYSFLAGRLKCQQDHKRRKEEVIQKRISLFK